MANTYLSSTLIREVLEIVWTIIPIIILVTLALPSLICLYTMEEIKTEIEFKAVGHQWYWRYETRDKEFDSYMREGGDFRLLDVDARIVIPYNRNCKTLITSADVLHSWTVPALGVKADAVPGRINQQAFMSLRPSILYGQCSEICGANHRFIPIVVESVPLLEFLGWTGFSYLSLAEGEPDLGDFLKKVGGAFSKQKYVIKGRNNTVIILDGKKVVLPKRIQIDSSTSTSSPTPKGKTKSSTI